VTHPLAGAELVLSHDPKHSVKGGQFKGGYDLLLPGGHVLAPFFGKIAHVYPDKTVGRDGNRCTVPVAPGWAQFTISEETIVRGDRHPTGFRLFLAHLVPLAGLVEKSHHVVEEQTLGWVERILHVSSNHDDRLRALLGL
jgi:hypothetical protein